MAWFNLSKTDAQRIAGLLEADNDPSAQTLASDIRKQIDDRFSADSVPLAADAFRIRAHSLNVSKASIQTFAENSARALNFDPTQARSIEVFVVHIGGKVVKTSHNATGDDAPDRLVVNGCKDFTIFVPTLTTPQFDRMAIATALGHLFLHYPQHRKKFGLEPMHAPRWPDKHKPDEARADLEAIWFAYAFLMPENAFRAAHNKYAGDASLIARTFGVTTKAASLRAHDFRATARNRIDSPTPETNEPEGGTA